MSIPTQKVEQIRDAAHALADSAEELLAGRDDPDADREDKATANEEFEQYLREMALELPKTLLKEVAR